MKSVLFTMLCMLTLLPVVATAQTPPADDSTAAIQTTRAQDTSTRRANRCSVANERVDLVTMRYEESRLRYVNRYTTMLERLQEGSERIARLGLDTITLDRHIADISYQMSNFTTAVENAIGMLKETKELACGESDGAYIEALQDARAQLEGSRDIAKAINTIVREDVLAELRALRALYLAEQA